jgi:transposase
MHKLDGRCLPMVTYHHPITGEGRDMTAYVGIDVSKAGLDVVLLQDEQQYHGVFDNHPTGFGKLLRWLEKRCVSSAHVCLEATGRYGQAVASCLHEAGYTVSVVNPARPKAFAESQLSRQKTDKADALTIAQFCRSQSPDAWTPPDPDQHELQAMVRHLDAMQAMRQQERNRLSSGVRAPAVIEALQQHIAFLDQQIDHFKQRIKQHIDQHPHLKEQSELLLSIPGLGDTTVAVLLAEIPAFQAFDRAPELAAYAGLTPQHRRSGSSVHRPSHISKRGNARLRRALYFPAMVAMRHNPILRAFAQRLQASGHAPKSVIVAVMRKLLHLAYGVLKSGRPFDPHYLSKRLAAP